MPRTKAFNEDVVLEKAMNLFWEKGYNATSMQELVSRLGINRASLYDTFGNKNQLFERAIEKYKSENILSLSDFLYQQLNVRQGLYLMLERYVDIAIADKQPKGCFIVNTTTEMANTDAAINDLLDDYKAKVETIYFNYLQYGINQGQISPYKDIKVISNYLYTLQSGINVIAKVQKDKASLMQIISTSLAILD